MHSVLVRGIFSSLCLTSVFRLQTEHLMAAWLTGGLKRRFSGRPITSTDIYNNNKQLAVTNIVEGSSGKRLRKALSKISAVGWDCGSKCKLRDLTALVDTASAPELLDPRLITEPVRFGSRVRQKY